jgi:hypothetical protein
MLRLSTLSLLPLLLLACGSDDTDSDTDTDGPGGDFAEACDALGVECTVINGQNVGFLTGVITQDITLTSNAAWVLRGGVFIGGDNENNTTLSIEAGTTIFGDSATDGFLAIRRGSKIDARGTKDAPIVMTSDKAVGQRARGDWGGLVILGNAPINSCAQQPCEAEIEGGAGLYGGSNPNDDSGVLEYVRVEFAGTEVSKDNELNGITFGGVGRATKVDYIQVHANLDDGIEMFGGTVDIKHVVVSCVGDDSIDWDAGWQGRLQFGLAVQCPDAGNHGIEADGNEANNAATPISNPILSHVTLIGHPDIPVDNFGIVLRRGTAGNLWNFVVTGFNKGCLSLRNAQTLAHFDDGTASIARTILDCDTAFEDADEPDRFNGGTGNVVGAAGLKNATYIADNPDFRPEASGAAASGGQAPSDSFFTAASYRGAFDPTAEPWTAGWTNFARQ